MSFRPVAGVAPPPCIGPSPAGASLGLNVPEIGILVGARSILALFLPAAVGEAVGC